MKLLVATILLLLLPALAPLRAETIIAVTNDKRLRHFDSETPGTFTKTIAITGIPDDQAIVGIDSSTHGNISVVTRRENLIRVYHVHPETGAVVRAGALQSGVPASATSFGVDVLPNRFDDDITVANNADILQTIGLTLGSPGSPIAYDNTTEDGDPIDQHAGADPSVVALAYTNNFVGGKSTVLYGIDSTQDSLVTIEGPSGRINTVGPLGVSASTRIGFDISGATGRAYAAIGDGTSFTTLYTVDLGTGAAASKGSIGGQFQQVGVNIVGIATLPPTRVVAISTRSRVGTGENVMVAGFIAVGGGDAARLVIRGIGPSLTSAGITSPLANPVLRIVDGNGIEVAKNDNWRSTQEDEIRSTGVAPTNDLEAAYVGTFAPGSYTAIVSGKNGGTGVGLVEIYELGN